MSLRANLAAILTAFLAPAVFAHPPDPLRLIPAQAGLVFQIEKPKKVIEGGISFANLRGLSEFPQVRTLLDSPQVRRFFQIVKFLEAQLGNAWPELLEKVAGGGIALGVSLDSEPQPAVLVVQGTDEAAVEKFYNILIKTIETDDGDGPKPVMTRGHEFGFETVTIGKDFFTARIGSAIVIANHAIALAESLKLVKSKTASQSGKLLEARKLVGNDALAWACLDFAKVKATPAGKDFFAATRKDLLQTLVVGGTIDALRRAEFIAFSLEQPTDGYTLRVRIPAKRAELDPAMALHAPFDGGVGSLPLLQPNGVIYSQSFYLDLGYFWKERRTVIRGDNVKDLEKAEADISKVLPGATFGKLLQMSGPYHRIVSAYTGEKLYSITPGQLIPPTAYVGSMRNAEYGQLMDGVLRAGALLAGFQTGWKMSEETFDGVKLTTYRFSEKYPPKYDDAENLRFNAAPTFAIFKDQLVLGSTPGIVKKLIPVLKAETKNVGPPAVWRASGYLAGAGELLKASPDATISQAVLTQGVGLTEATKQVRELVSWLTAAGQVGLSIDHAEQFLEFEFSWKIPNANAK